MQMKRHRPEQIVTLLRQENRCADHIWWISDLTHFQEHYPNWKLQYKDPQILQEIYEMSIERWSEERPNAKEKTASAP
jgi:hypothetical protein